jgi:dynein heavy chain
MSPTTLMAEPLIICHFAQGLGEKTYDRVHTFADLSTTLTSALAEYNETNAVMNLVLFEDAIRHVCRISRIIESPGGHALLVGVGGSGKQSLSRLAAFVSSFTVFQVVISATYGVNELKADLQTMYRKSGLKGEQMAFLFTDQQIADERFLVYLNDMLSSGDIPGLFAPEDQDDIVNVVRPLVKRSGLSDSRENCWSYFISQVKANLHAILCFSPVGEPIKVRTRRFPALVNTVVIDWFQPWPEDALFSVSKRFLDELDLGSADEKEAVIGFMPFSFVAVNEASKSYIETERRYNWTTPKSFLELIALYKAMLARRRRETNDAITRLSNGVTKLEKTAKEVGELEESLKIKQVEVEEKKIQCDAMIPKLDSEKAKASDEAAKANVIASAASEKEKAVGEMKIKIEHDLNAAEPALVKASAALDSLNKKDLGELKSLAKPPAGIDDVTGACVYLLHPGGKGKIDVSWKASQSMMKDVNKFLDELMTFKDKIDAGEIPKQNFKNIRPLLEKEWFNVDTMRNKSSAAAGLCDWVVNIVVYWDINENVEPMREMAAAAVVQLEEAISSKNAALAKKDEAEATVAELTKAYNDAVAEKEAVIAEAEACMRKLGLAQRLMSALGSEGERWKNSVADLKRSMPILVGDALLAAAFVSYNGCFNRHYREWLTKSKFLPYLSGSLKEAKGGVPMGADADPLKILTNDAEIASWSNEGLPTDRISVENGTIVCNCARWPLMIDPQLQGITWIKKREEKRGLHIVRLGQKQLIPKLENALENGKPIIIENLATTVDAVLAPVIGRQVTRRGRTVFVKLGDKEVDYHPDFKLYMQTKLSNPHYPPEIQAECTLINFMVTEDGLEDQLLALTVLKERPDLEEQKAVLIAQMNGFKIKTKELEDGILEQLANAEGDILENITLIENLEDSKRVSLEIAEKAKIAAVTEVEINTAREMYRRVAARGSLMFFLLATLNKVHTFYHFSLSSFNTIVERAITGRRGQLVWNEEAIMSNIAPAKLKRALLDDAAERKKAIAATEPEQFEARMNFLVDNITFKVFDATRRGLLERHKLILATQLLLKVMAKAGELDAAEADYLTSGRASMSPPQMTAKVQEFLTAKQWANACALKEVDAFKNLTEDLELGTDAWSEWLDFERPEIEVLPGEWEKKLKPFQKLLILRALRTDRVTTSLTAFIEERLGARYTQQEPFDMDDTFNDSSYKQPLFFVLFPGVDPGVAIERLGRKLGFTAEQGNYVSISMGQGQEANAENTIDRFAKDGGWVFLQNIHLMSTWLPTLDRKLEIVAESGSHDFRAFLSAEPPPMMLESEMQTVPEGVLQASIKVANEPPTDLKATLRSSYALFDQATLDRSSKPRAHRPMLFTLAFFHSLVLGRRKFGFQGFSRNYPYNNGDITVCSDVLNNYVESRAQLPWADLKYIWGEIMYGGHITDSWDRRCMSAYLDVLLVDDLVDEKSPFQLAPGFRCLLEGDFAAYRLYIEDAMPSESPTLFGLHPNSEISLLIENCEALFKAVFILQGGGSGGGGGSNKEGRVRDLIVEMQAQLPTSFLMLEVKTRVKEKTPYVVFVLQVRAREKAREGAARRGARARDGARRRPRPRPRPRSRARFAARRARALACSRACPAGARAHERDPRADGQRDEGARARPLGRAQHFGRDGRSDRLPVYQFCAAQLAQDVRPDRPDGQLQPEEPRLLVPRPQGAPPAARRMGKGEQARARREGAPRRRPRRDRPHDARVRSVAHRSSPRPPCARGARSPLPCLLPLCLALRTRTRAPTRCGSAGSSTRWAT